MDLKSVVMIMILVGMLVFAGCNQTEDVEGDLQEDVVVEVEEKDSTEVEAVLEEAVEEEETVVEKTEDATEPEETVEEEEIVEADLEEEAPEVNETVQEVIEEESGETIELEIEYFRTEPDSDWTINKGDTIQWTNKMPNYVHRIALFNEEEDGTFGQRWFNEVEDTLTGETYSYTFNETGKFKWGSLTKFDKIYGYITVI